MSGGRDCHWPGHPPLGCVWIAVAASMDEGMNCVDQPVLGNGVEKANQVVVGGM